jgi:hypothetical protein
VSLRRLTTDRLVLRQPTDDDLRAYMVVTDGEESEREHKDAVAHWRAHGFGPGLVLRHEADGVTRSGHPARLYRARR